jgi:hypothetical protein
MCEMHLVIKNMAELPPLYYDAVEGAKEISKDMLDLAKCVVNIKIMTIYR